MERIDEYGVDEHLGNNADEIFEIDEDLIPAYKCMGCNANICKDDVGCKLEGHKWNEVLCIECYQKFKSD